MSIRVSSGNVVPDKKLVVRKKKLNKKFRFLFKVILILLALFCVYLMLDISNIKNFSITGNQIVTDSGLFAKLKEYKEKKVLLLNEKKFRKELQSKVPFIKSLEIKKDILENRIDIEIEEYRLVGYTISNGAIAITSEGKRIDIDDEYKYLITKLPVINGVYSDDDMFQIADALNKIDDKTISLISEINRTSFTYEQDVLELIMMDGNRIYVSFARTPSVNYYTSIMSNLTYERNCIYVDDSTGNMWATEYIEPEEAQDENPLPEDGSVFSDAYMVEEGYVGY